MKKIAVFASGNGSNFQTIAEKVQSGAIPAELVLLFSDHREAYVLQRAGALGVPSAAIELRECTNKVDYEETVLAILREYKVDYIVLAGYMKIVGATLLDAFPNKIVNIHPALLPSFPGAHGIEDAWKAGVAVTGVTVHFIDSGVDTGPIIAQEEVVRTKEDTIDSLEEKIHAVEHILYPRVLAEILS
jgi:phosphoribosylglycinamide formyltransferase-1